MLRAAARELPGFDLRHPSAALGRDKVARILVPAGEPPAGGWPLCYLLHSFGGSRLSWLEALGGRANAPPWSKCILIAPESGRRWFINDAAGLRYEDYLVEDLPAAVEEAAGVPARRAAPAARALVGFSMGGAAAVTLALRRPDRFGYCFSYAGAFYANRREGDPYASERTGAACMMPTEAEHERVWGPPGSAVRRQYDPDRQIERAAASGRRPEIGIELGLEDYPRVVEMNRAMHRALGSAGLAHHYAEGPGGHDWPSAVRSVGGALDAWLGRA